MRGMAVRFVLGRAGAGKTEHCLSQIASALREASSGEPLLLLVPEQSTLQMEQALVARSPRKSASGRGGAGYARARVLSFSSLANAVFDETGRPARLISPAARRFALRMLLDRVETDRAVFARVIDSPGFLQSIDQALLQFQRCDVGEEDLRTLAANEQDATLAAKLALLAELYARYRAWLGEERIDAPGLQRLLCRRLRAAESLRGVRLWVDGFAGFSALETAALIELCRGAAHAEISLLLDAQNFDPHSRTGDEAAASTGLFAPIQETRIELERRLRSAGVEVDPPLIVQPRTPPRFATAPRLVAIESYLASGGDGAAPGHVADVGDSLRVIRCATQRDELRAAAHEIRSLVTRSAGAIRFADFALMSRDLSECAGVVREIFDEYEIPIFLDQRRSLSGHPLARAMAALFDAALHDVPPESAIALLHTGLTRASRDIAERMEEAIRRHSIRGRDLWLSRIAWDFDSGRRLPVTHEDDADDVIVEERDVPPDGDEAISASLAEARANLLSAIDELVAPHAAGATPTGREWAERLYSALHHLGAAEALAAWAAEAEASGDLEARDSHRAAWAATLELLQDLHDVLGEERVALPVVADLINDALKTRTFGLAPPTTDQVLVSAVDRSRHPELRFAWLFGMNDGVFPQPEQSSSLFSAEESDRLADAGVADFAATRRHSEDERLLYYIATTRASQRLTMSYARFDAKGDERPPSRWLRELSIGAVDAAPPEATPVTLRELTRGLLTSEGATGDASHRALQELADRSGELGTRLRRLLGGRAYMNRPAELGNFRRARDEAAGVIWRASPTEIESYLQCPFRHFVRYGLRLSEAAAPRPMHLDLGEALHEILAESIADSIGQADWTAWLERGWELALDRSVRRWIARLPATLQRRRAAWWHRARSIRAVVEPKLQSVVDGLRRGAFRPLRVEAAFGRSSERAVLLPIDESRAVAIIGQIDRIDVGQGDAPPSLVIHDYKSTAKSLGHPLLLGSRLQVFLYALAAPALAGGDERDRANPAQAIVSGVFLSPLFPDLSAAEKEYFRAAPADQRAYLYRPFGAFADTIADALDQSLSHGRPSPVARMRLKKPTKKDPAPGFNSRESGDVLTPEDFEQRLEQARETLRRAAEGVAKGDISIAPLVLDRTRACKNCEFGHVCRFEPARNASRPAEAVLPIFRPSKPANTEERSE